eukprot:symbB.v1.2.013712.t1/scaffold922.1/size178049/4
MFVLSDSNSGCHRAEALLTLYQKIPSTLETARLATTTFADSCSFWRLWAMLYLPGRCRFERHLDCVVALQACATCNLLLELGER